MKHMPRLALLALALASPACGSSDDTSAPDATNCASDSRAEQFTAGMGKLGDAGLIHFTLVSSTPAPPARNDNDWVIALTDAGGTPLTGATMSVKPFMPDHNHGTGIVASVNETSTPGTYDASPVNLFMPGVWEVTITARPAGGGAADTDAAKFTFCVDN